MDGEQGGGWERTTKQPPKFAAETEMLGVCVNLLLAVN